VEAANVVFDDMNAEMVINGGFESGSTGWTLFNGAVVENGRLKGVTTNSAGIGTMLAVQHVPVLPDNTYKVSCKVSGYVDNNNYPRFGIEERGFTRDFYINGIVRIPNTYDYLAEITFTTNADTYYMNVILMSFGTCTAYFDDISVQLVN
jgi:hypothetical protein